MDHQNAMENGSNSNNHNNNHNHNHDHNRQTTNDKRQTTNNKQQTTSNKQQATNNKQHHAIFQHKKKLFLISFFEPKKTPKTLDGYLLLASAYHLAAKQPESEMKCCILINFQLPRSRHSLRRKSS